MNLRKCLASISVTMMVGLAAPLAWGQATEPGMAGSTPVAPAAVSPIVPAERIAPGVPGIPPNAPAPIGSAASGSRVQSKGKDVTADSAEAMGRAGLRKGIKDEAARDSETALRSFGVIPIGLDQDAGESNSRHQLTRNAN